MASPAPVIVNSPGVIDAVRAAIGAAFVDGAELVGELGITVTRDSIATVLTTLRDDFAYQQLMEIAGVDYPARVERFEVVYHLLSVTKNRRLRIRVATDAATPVPSVTSVYANANWLEREVFDMYGVVFAGHPDLRRILTDYGFAGHPFRKDFPLTGYVELRYSEAEKRVVYEPVALAQDFRSFDFMTPWEGAEYILPGDEKAAVPEAKGAPTPLSADQVKRGDAPKGTPPPGTLKPDEAKAQTGANDAASPTAASPAAVNYAAASPAATTPKARKPRAIAPAVDASAQPAPRRRAPRKPKGEA